jgi:hypothetical protein
LHPPILHCDLIAKQASIVADFDVTVVNNKKEGPEISAKDLLTINLKLQNHFNKNQSYLSQLPKIEQYYQGIRYLEDSLINSDEVSMNEFEILSGLFFENSNDSQSITLKSVSNINESEMLVNKHTKNELIKLEYHFKSVKNSEKEML